MNGGIKNNVMVSVTLAGVDIVVIVVDILNDIINVCERLRGGWVCNARMNVCKLPVYICLLLISFATDS